jgi:potassium-transporting ATPase KdpC subunit
MINIIREIKTAVALTAVIGLLACGLYPAFVFGIARVFFNEQANGSLIFHNGRLAGSKLISQGFSGPEYFHPRPSAAGNGYDAERSGGSNLGPLSKKLFENLKTRAQAYRTINCLAPDSMIPADAVTASASGLDPHISVKNALLQVSRVAHERKMGENYIRRKVVKHTEARDLGFLGEPCVNVLMLNLDLDRERSSNGREQG